MKKYPKQSIWVTEVWNGLEKRWFPYIEAGCEETKSETYGKLMRNLREKRNMPWANELALDNMLHPHIRVVEYRRNPITSDKPPRIRKKM